MVVDLYRCRHARIENKAQILKYYTCYKLFIIQFYSYIVMKESINIQRLSIKAGITEKTDDLIAKRRAIIEKLNESRQHRLRDIQKQLQDKQLQPCLDEDQIYVQGHSISKPKSRTRSRVISKQPSQPIKASDKNQGIGEMDKMVFDKKFKNYLNHKQQFLDKAKRRQEAILEKRRKIKQGENDVDDYFNEEEILSNTGEDYQFKDAEDMQYAYDGLATGKKKKKGGIELFYAEKFEFAFRLLQFEALMNIMEDPSQALISKQLLLNYLFDEPMIMMLYSFNPYQVADQIAQLQTEVPQMLCFEQFSLFLLTDRSPTYFQYTEQNLAQARDIGRGLKCAPIVGKWIDQTGIYEDLIDIFNSVDMFGNDKAQRAVLAKKLTLQCEKKRIMDIEVVQIVNINKLVPLRRLIYEIQHQVGGSEMVHKHQFQEYLLHYHRLPTPEKDVLVTKLIMVGKYDTSYIYIVSQEVLKFLKEVFNQMEKFAEYFVKKEKFIQKVIKNKKYAGLKNLLVRSQNNKYVNKQTVEQTLMRIFNEGDIYIDIQQIMDFFSNRGRPRVIQYHVYLANLERQLAILKQQERIKLKILEETGEQPSTSSDEQFQKQLKRKQIARKHQKLADIRNNMKYDYSKKFNVTIPITFDFEKRDKTSKISIRQRKVKQMLEEKKRQQEEQMKPIPRKQVPKHVKQNLYEKMLRDEARQRKQRLERYRLQIQESMIPVSQNLTRPLNKTDPHCDFGRQPYQFVARPMPWYCQVNLLDRINKKKQERREKILQQILNRHHDCDLPEGVLRMMQRHEQIAQKRLEKQSASTASIAGQCTFIPKISQNIPDFKAIHQRLGVDLEIAKQNKQTFHPAPFSFENRQKKTRSHIHCAPKFNDGKLRHSREYKRDENQVQIKPTLKFIGLVQKRRQEREAKQKKMLQLQQKNEIRKMRQQKFAPQVRRILQKNENQLGQSRQQMLDRIKQFQRQEKKKARQYENKMIDIYTKVWNRPLLIEGNQFGQNQIKNNSRLGNDENIGATKTAFKETDVRQKRDNRPKMDKQYQQKRRRAIEQPPGQYLLQQDQEQPLGHHQHEIGHEVDNDEDEEYSDEGYFIENSGMRTS